VHAADLDRTGTRQQKNGISGFYQQSDRKLQWRRPLLQFRRSQNARRIFRAEARKQEWVFRTEETKRMSHMQHE
jgi:hypothetical protein